MMTGDEGNSAIDAVLDANRRYAPDYDPALVSPVPRLHLAVLTCMDTRLSYKAMGLRPGDAHLIRNAGGIVTSDAVRSLLVSQHLLGTREIMIVNHTDCGLMKATEEELHQCIERMAGVPANTPVTFHAFKDVAKNVRKQMRILISHSWIRAQAIRGFVFDVADGHLKEVKL
jgi:carbonic anhydrase